MSPQLVEYSEDDDTGCGFGVIVLGTVVCAAVIAARLVMQWRPNTR